MKCRTCGKSFRQFSFSWSELKTLAPNCTHACCEGLPESVNNRIFTIASGTIYSAIKIKCFSQSVSASNECCYYPRVISTTATSLWRSYTLPFPKITHAISQIFFPVKKKNLEITLQWKMMKTKTSFFLLFSGFRISLFGQCKRPRSMARNAQYTWSRQNASKQSWRSGEKERKQIKHIVFRRCVVLQFLYNIKPLSILLHMTVGRSKYRLRFFGLFHQTIPYLQYVLHE